MPMRSQRFLHWVLHPVAVGGGIYPQCFVENRHLLRSLRGRGGMVDATDLDN